MTFQEVYTHRRKKIESKHHGTAEESTSEQQRLQSVMNFEKFQIYIPVFHLTASLPDCWSPIDPLALGVLLQIFHTRKVIISDLRKFCSDEDSSTVPWYFF